MANLSRPPGFELHGEYVPSALPNQSFTEPIRRFIQREGFEPQANEIPSTMPSWMPGDDYYTNFRVGDPYVKVDQGFARLPGAGYAALHPELKDVNPEDYPDIHKMSILADVAPYSREYNTYWRKVGKQAQGNTELQIEYEKVLDRLRQTKESVVPMTHRHFTEPVDEIEGTVDSVSPGGITWYLRPAGQQITRARAGEARFPVLSFLLGGGASALVQLYPAHASLCRGDHRSLDEAKNVGTCCSQKKS